MTARRRTRGQDCSSAKHSQLNLILRTLDCSPPRACGASAKSLQVPRRPTREKRETFKSWMSCRSQTPACRDRKWPTNPRCDRRSIQPGRCIWRRTLTTMLRMDVDVCWSDICSADGKRARTMPKNSHVPVSRILSDFLMSIGKASDEEHRDDNCACGCWMLKTELDVGRHFLPRGGGGIRDVTGDLWTVTPALPNAYSCTPIPRYRRATLTVRAFVSICTWSQSRAFTEQSASIRLPQARCLGRNMTPIRCSFARCAAVKGAHRSVRAYVPSSLTSGHEH
jgi:hypothetical protein